MLIMTCKICKNSFFAKPVHVRMWGGKYCSMYCRNEGQKKGKFVACLICNKSIWRMPKEIKHSKSGKFFCSRTCQTLWRNTQYVGARHVFWKTGIRSYRNLLKRSSRKKVCAGCGIKDIRILAVHHVDKNRFNNKIENLKWLCHNCHFLVHHYNLNENRLNK